MFVVRSHRALACAAVALLAGCMHGADVPPWLTLHVGVQARLTASNELEPERTMIAPSADAARATQPDRARRRAAAGDLVTVIAIDGNVVDGKHAVEIADAHGVLGWVLAEDVLRPVPPRGTPLIVAVSGGGSERELFSEQDDDDGQAFGATSHVTYEGFTSDPGNPEYRVHVDDGTLAGYDGYVTASELQAPPTNGFRLVAPAARFVMF